MKWALIAGQGRLPVALLRAEPHFVATMVGFDADQEIQPDLRFRIEHLGSAINLMREKGCDHICLAGAVRRPSIDPAAIDGATMPLLAKLMPVLNKGDDALLRAVLAVFADAGLAPVSAHALRPDLLPASDTVLGPVQDSQVISDSAQAMRVLSKLGALDIGQACVIRKGRVLAVEADPGTDWMLNSLTDGIAHGGVLVKAPKPDQDRRIDLPTIGPQTIQHARAIGLRAVVIEAGGVLLLDRDICAQMAQDAGITLWVRP